MQQRGQAVPLSLIPLVASKMTELPPYEIKAFTNNDLLPVEAEAMFARQLADSRKMLPLDRVDRDQWQFGLTCAVTPDGHVLGGVHLDIGPICGAGLRSLPERRGLERRVSGASSGGLFGVTSSGSPIARFRRSVRA